MRRPYRSAIPLLVTLATPLWIAGCDRSVASGDTAASSEVVRVAAVTVYETSRTGVPDALDASRLDRAVERELERRSRAERRPTPTPIAPTIASTSRPDSSPTAGTRAPAAAMPRLEPGSAGPAASEPLRTDRFRAIPLELPSTAEPPSRREPVERFSQVDLVVPAGARLEVELAEALSSQKSKAGEVFRARVVAPVSIDGYFAVPLGAEVVGHVEEVAPARRLGGKARLRLAFDRLVLPEADLALSASLYEEARGEGKDDAATIAGATAAGAIVGRAIGDRNRSRGGTIGALIGAAIGTGIAAAREGESIELPAGSRLVLSLDEAIEVTVRLRVLEVS